MSKLFTIGYGGRKPSDFVESLKSAGVKMIVDVRHNPHRACMGSYVLAKSPEKGIRKLLRTAGIDYVSLAESLGNPDSTDPDMKEFRTVIAAGFSQRTRELVEIASASPTALLCAEKHYQECHRSIIAEYLESIGWEIEHLH